MAGQSVPYCPFHVLKRGAYQTLHCVYFFFPLLIMIMMMMMMMMMMMTKTLSQEGTHIKHKSVIYNVVHATYIFISFLVS